jgi:hypothetical protein
MHTLVRRASLFALPAALVLSALLLIGHANAQQKDRDTKLPPMADQTIPGSPLRIVVRDNGSAGVFYNDAAQFYFDYAEGVFLWADGRVWGPTVPSGPLVHAYTTLSNNLSGNGTAANPWRVTTLFDLGDSDIQLMRNVRYINGELATRQNFEVRNTGTRTYTINLFHAADLKTAGVDSGYGMHHASTGGIGGYNEARTFYQLFMPVTPGSRYKEGFWSDIWSAIGNTSGPGPGFNNSNQPDTLLDNGAGLQWTLTLPPMGRVAVADFHTFTTSPGCAGSFIDVYPSDFYFETVSYLSCLGAITGYADGTFRPGANTTRAQLSKIIVLAEGWPINTSGGPHFSDVLADNPFYDHVETAYNRGIITGYADGTFRPGNNVTRAQLSKIIVLAEGWPINTSGGPHFSDVPATHPFYSYVETALNHGIITGYADGTFRPGNPATRGQISKIVHGAVTQP